ncbi:MAG: hypothetical protein JWM59_4519 [Verrucomicrobiales bacterium]|nr:hypothetical protein [Verrucomicrobiales bacterium]
MKYAVTFAAVSLAMLAGSMVYPGLPRLLVWPALSFGGVALGYAGLGPRVFGKTGSGEIRPWFRMLHLPYFVFTWGVWHICRLLSREAALNRIDEGLVIGRRLLPGEAPEGFDHYVDLTAEFEEPHPIRTRPGYRCLPILDAGVPTLDELRRAVELCSDGRVFVHCAQGHGRTGLFALALLLRRGNVRTVGEGISLLQSLRPAVSLNGGQTAFAHRYLQATAG